MLLPDNINPELCVYYNGAIMIKSLKETNNQSLLGLYKKVKTDVDMSFSMFLLCLDWLFLINVAVVDKSGSVILCI
jgi:hypothetical protein